MYLEDSEGDEIYVHVGGKHGDDIQIVAAWYVHVKKELTDETLEFIRHHYADKLMQEWFECKIDEAEYLC